MKRSRIVMAPFALVVALAFSLFAGACGSLPAGVDGPEDSIGAAQVKWAGYTMGFDLISDDQDKLPPSPSGNEPKGKALKVCFRYIADDADSGGFVSKTLFEKLNTSDIFVKDANGNICERLSYISDVTMKGDLGGAGFGMADTMPRFSIVFDIPADASTEDYVLCTGTGPDRPLQNYESAEYATRNSGTGN